MKSIPTNRFQSAKRLLTVIFAGCALSLQAHATAFTWDADGVDPLNDGAGNWNPTGGTNWANGATYGAWGNTTADEAIFGAASGAADTITVGTVNANKLTFNAPGSGNYTLTGGAITLGGASPTINANVNARIDSTITSTTTNAFIRGTGTLTLGGTATFTGGPNAWDKGVFRYGTANSTVGIGIVTGANITATNFSLMQDNAVNCTINYNQTGGTVAVSGEFGLGGSFAGGSSGTNTATISGGTLTAGVVSLYKWATSNLNVNSAGTVNATSLRIGWGDSSPTGTINIGDGATFSGGTSINDGGTSGVLKVNAWDVRSNRNYTLNFNGGTLKAGAAGTNWLQAGAFTNARVQEAGGIIDNGGYAITIAQALNHGGVAATDGGLIFKGSGTTTLTGAVSYTGLTRVAAGTLAGSTTLGDVSVANTCTLEGGNAGTGTLTAANVTLGSVATDTTALKGKVSATAGYKPLAVTNLTLNGADGTVNLDVTGTGLTNGNTYDLLVSANPISAPNATSVLAALKSGARAFAPAVDIDGKKIQVYYDANASIYWTGANGSAWNFADTNWKLAGNDADTQFLANDVVFFHDNPTADTVDISGANVSPAATTFDNTTATSYTLGGTHGIAAGSITKTNDGTVFITNSNPTAGAVNLDGGTVSISQTGGLGTGNLTFDGGALDYTGATTTWTRNLTTNTNGGTLGVTNGTALTLGGTLGGTGALTKTGAGILYVSTLNAGATLILAEGTNYGNTGGGIKGNLQVNTGATFSNSTFHIFDAATARVHVNGGTLGGGVEYYLPGGASAADPGVQMTGGTINGGEKRWGTGTSYVRVNATDATATFSSNVNHYAVGGSTVNFEVVGGTVPSGVDFLCTGTMGYAGWGGTVNYGKTGVGLMEMTGSPVLAGNGTFSVTDGTLRLTGTNAVTNFGGTGVVLDAANAVTLQLNAANAGDNLTFGKGITGGSASAAVTKLGDGNVTFTTAKTYLGAMETKPY